MRLGGGYFLKVFLVAVSAIISFGSLLGTAQARTRVEVSIFYPGAAYNAGLLNSFEGELKVNFTSAKWYQDWATSFDSQIAQRFHSNGYIPELTWEPQLSGTGVSYDAVVAGSYDGYINQTATAVKNLGFPIRISLGPEMNTDWVPWGIGSQGNNRTNHKAFWQHVVQKFRDVGATNAQWIWSPNVRPWNASTLYGSYAELYPGSDYVDYMGLDGYNWGTSQSWSSWQSFREVFESSYNELAGVSGKSILIMEISSAEAGGSKAAWITDMFSQLQSSFPRIVGFTWFHINKETDWRITSSAAAMASFTAGYNGTAIAAPPTTAGSNASGGSSSTSTNAKTSAGASNPGATTGEGSASSEPTASTEPDAIVSQYVVTTPVEPKIAGSLIASDTLKRQLASPQFLSLLIASLFGATFIGFIYQRRFRLLRQPHRIEPFAGFGLVDSVFSGARAPRQPFSRHRYFV